MKKPKELQSQFVTWMGHCPMGQSFAAEKHISS